MTHLILFTLTCAVIGLGLGWLVNNWVNVMAWSFL